jgi:hypothetical protein
MATVLKHPPERNLGASLPRRAALQILSALAIAAGPVHARTAVAGQKSNRKARRKARRKAARICHAQVDECQELIVAICLDRPDPEECAAPTIPCCEFLAECDATSLLNCLFPSIAASE